MTEPPEISIIYCTNKLGSIDLLKHSLLNQDFPLEKVEVLLIDDFYSLRRKEVAEYLEDAPFAYRHLPSASERVFNLAAKFNQALVLAEGELIVPLEDYEWADRDWLKTHYEVWKEKGPDVTVQGLTHDCAMPKNKFDAPIQDIREILLPEERIHEALISVFPGTEWKGVKLEVERPDTKWESYEVESGDFLPPLTTHVYRNVSLPLERFLELNGYDEAYDGDEPEHFQIDPTADVYWRAEAQDHRFLYMTEGLLFHMDHWKLFTWERTADYGHMYQQVHAIAAGRQNKTAPNPGRKHLKMLREYNWRTSRARRLSLGRISDHCQFDIIEVGESDAAITAKVYRKARRYLYGRERILDSGCGAGGGMEGLEDTVGIDISKTALQEAREKGCEVVMGDVRRLPFKDGSFGGVLSIETLEHILEGDEYMKEARRVLKDRGLLVLSTPDGGPAVGSHLRMYSRGLLAELLNAHLNPLHLEVVPWPGAPEDKLLARAVKE